MRYTHVRKADLNLLANFQALMEERNVTRAARRMFLSQPAMSRSFERLRQMLNDELLIWTAKGYEPTKRAAQFYAEIEQILPKLDALLRGHAFSPAESADSFRIATSGYASVWILPTLIQSLAQRAPHAQVEISPWDDGFRKLEANAIDVLLSSAEPPHPLRSEPLVHEIFVCLVSRDYPLRENRFTLRRYLAGKHLSVTVADGRQGSVDRTLDHLGKERNVRVKIPKFLQLISPRLHRRSHRPDRHAPGRHRSRAHQAFLHSHRPRPTRIKGLYLQSNLAPA